MKRLTRLAGVSTALFLIAVLVHAQSSDFRVLAFYSTQVEQDHVDFARQAIAFYQDLARREHFTFDATTNWDDLSPKVLKNYQVILWLGDFPQQPAQKTRF